MFASYLIHQGIDFVLGLVLTAVTMRWLPSPDKASSIRHLLIRQFPCGVLVLGLAAVLIRIVGQPIAEWLSYEPISIKFLGLGAAYYSWMVIFPTWGLVLCLRPGLGSPGQRAVAVLWAATSFAIVGWSIFIEPFRLQVETTRLEFDRWPAEFPPLRVVVLADLQSPLLTRRERLAVELVREQKPDLILIPGDLASQTFDENHSLESVRYVLQRIEAPLGIFVVNGDADCFVSGGMARLVEGTSTRYLDNKALALMDDLIEIGGFDPGEADAFEAALERHPSARFRIGLVHRPRYAEAIAKAGFDLVVAGHTHGGQVTVPGFGPPITASPLPRHVCAGGAHPLSHQATLYVSRGVGMEAGFAPPIRFLSPPEISVLTLAGPRKARNDGLPLESPPGKQDQ